MGEMTLPFFFGIFARWARLHLTLMTKEDAFMRFNVEEKEEELFAPLTYF